MEKVGLGTHHEIPGKNLVHSEGTILSLLENVSESGDSETLADCTDPHIFHRTVCAGAGGGVSHAETVSTADSDSADSVRHGDLNTVSFCTALPLSAVCPVHLHIGRNGADRGNGICQKIHKTEKECGMRLKSGKKIIY